MYPACTKLSLRCVPILWEKENYKILHSRKLFVANNNETGLSFFLISYEQAPKKTDKLSKKKKLYAQKKLEGTNKNLIVSNPTILV